MKKIPLMDLYAFNKDIQEDVNTELNKLVVSSSFVGGKYLEEFETSYAKFCETNFCIGVANGTEALSVILRALEIGSGDEVITTTHTFIATVEAILCVGATAVLVDIDPKTALIDLTLLEKAITPKTKAIMPVHLYGSVVDLDRLTDMAKSYRVALIQDAAQAHGGRWNNKPLGAFGEAQSYSFFPGKNLGAWGDAGAITTNDENLATKMSAIRNHGRLKSEKYLHHLFGANWRMDPLQAMVLNKKLTFLDAKNRLRCDLYKKYVSALIDVGDLSFLDISPKAASVHHLFVVRTKKRDSLRAYLTEHEIETGIHYPVPLHQQPALKNENVVSRGPLHNAEELSTQILSLPFFPEITDDSLERLFSTIKDFFRG